MNAAAVMADFLDAASRGPVAAAEHLEALADKLLAQAALLRAAKDAPPGTRSEGGTGDRVRMQVVGPDGAVKQTAEAGHE